VKPVTLEQHEAQFQQLKGQLQQLERRNWLLWWAAVTVILLVTLAVASFSFPHLIAAADRSYEHQLVLAVRGLIGLVLLFNIYTLYQQTLITRLRRGLLEQRLLVEGFRELAMFDSLTGLFSRRFGEERLRAEMARAQRHSHPLTVLLLDLDNFKQINDRYGHGVGDVVLKEFGEALKRASRGSDLAVRMGGDEFLVLLPECRSDQVRFILHRLTHMDVRINEQQLPTTFSVGCSDYHPGESSEALLLRADQALYDQKRTGSLVDIYSTARD